MNDARPLTNFRPLSRRRRRLALGVALGAVAVAANVVVYSSLDDSETAVQAVTDIPAGALVTTDMLRTVDVDVDPTVQVVPGDDLELVAGRYAKVRITSGALVTTASLQGEPLVSVGSAVVAVRLDSAEVPVGLRERSRVRLVIGPSTADQPVRTVDGRAVGLPLASDQTLSSTTLSVEVADGDASIVAAADEVRVVLLEPRPDPAIGTD